MAGAPERVLALQRAAGNAATTRMLARRGGATSTPVLRILLVPGNATTLSAGARRVAVETMRAELARVVRSSNRAVRSGIRIEEASSAPSGDLGDHTLVVYFINGPDGDLALRLAKEHLSLSSSQDEELRRHLARQLAASGGANVALGNRSVCFVATTTFEAVQHSAEGLDARTRTMYERSVGLRMAEIALHEVGHALGADHTSEGLMVGTRTVTLTDQHAAHYSDESAGVVRGAIESIESSGRMPAGHSH